ncbi:MAG: hypothetical protein H6622_15370 [Halobacteriovoraceae bacterium]|nr:hypothetical protein [Halobacteriovoraceae bacterium]
MVKIIVAFFILFKSSIAQVKYKKSRWEEKTLSHKDQLLKFSMRNRKYEVHFKDGYVTYGTRSTFIVETTDEIALPQYAIRQYVKGEVYSSEIVNGRLEKYYNYKIKSKGKLLTFKLKDFVVEGQFDSEILGHVEKNTTPNFYYKVPFSPFDIDSERYDYLGALKEYELRSFFYLNFWSPQFYKSNGFAKNVDVEYKTCLVYLPDLSNDLACFEWNEKGIYDLKYILDPNKI